MDNSIQTEVKRARRLETAPMRYRGILEAAWRGKSRKTAIKAQCLECVGFDVAAVKECTAWACPLFEVRPYVKHGALEEEQDAEPETPEAAVG